MLSVVVVCVFLVFGVLKPIPQQGKICPHNLRARLPAAIMETQKVLIKRFWPDEPEDKIGNAMDDNDTGTDGKPFNAANFCF